MTALMKARPSPTASSQVVFSGKSPRWSASLSRPLRSIELINAIPASEARTAMSLRTLNFSTRKRAPKRSVKTLEVLVRIVLEATVVYSRQAATK
jgi:hypothetical protein